MASKVNKDVKGVWDIWTLMGLKSVTCGYTSGGPSLGLSFLLAISCVPNDIVQYCGSFCLLSLFCCS